MYVGSGYSRRAVGGRAARGAHAAPGALRAALAVRGAARRQPGLALAATVPERVLVGFKPVK